MATSLSYSHRNEYPPGVTIGNHQQAFFSPSQAGSTNSPSANENAVREYLQNNGWAYGLSQSFLNNADKSPMRYVVTDCSTVMSTRQTRIIENNTGRSSQTVVVTQWDELVTSLRFHAGLASAAKVASEFRIGQGENPPQRPLLIGGFVGPKTTGLTERFSNGPQRSKICTEIREIVNEITLNATQLKTLGKKVVIIIATDSTPCDGNLLECLLPVNGLPVKMVVRLCSDDQRVISYWDDMKARLFVPVDILQDFLREAVVHRNIGLQSWLTYGLPLHRLREYGMTAFDKDNKKENSEYSAAQLRTFCAFLFGANTSQLPDPESRRKDFMFAIGMLNDREKETWNPVTNRMALWLKFEDFKAMDIGEVDHSGDCCAPKKDDDCCVPGKKGAKKDDDCCVPGKKDEKKDDDCCVPGKKGAKKEDDCCVPGKKDEKKDDDCCVPGKKDEKKDDDCCVPGKKDEKKDDDCCVPGKKDEKKDDDCCVPGNVDAKKDDDCCVPGKKGAKKDDDCCVPGKKDAKKDDDCCVPGKEDEKKDDDCCVPGKKDEKKDDDCCVPGKKDEKKDDDCCVPGKKDDDCCVPGKKDEKKDDDCCVPGKKDEKKDDDCCVPGKKDEKKDDDCCVPGKKDDDCCVPGKKDEKKDDDCCVPGKKDEKKDDDCCVPGNVDAKKDDDCCVPGKKDEKKDDDCCVPGKKGAKKEDDCCAPATKTEEAETTKKEKCCIM